MLHNSLIILNNIRSTTSRNLVLHLNQSSNKTRRSHLGIHIYMINKTDPFDTATSDSCQSVEPKTFSLLAGVGVVTNYWKQSSITSYSTRSILLPSLPPLIHILTSYSTWSNSFLALDITLELPVALLQLCYHPFPNDAPLLCAFSSSSSHRFLSSLSSPFFQVLSLLSFQTFQASSDAAAIELALGDIEGKKKEANAGGRESITRDFEPVILALALLFLIILVFVQHIVLFSFCFSNYNLPLFLLFHRCICFIYFCPYLFCFPPYSILTLFFTVNMSCP